MRIIVDIGHPAHVHFFKNFIWEMRRRGHEILITASKKEVALDLLKAYDLDYIFTCKRYRNIGYAYELIRRDMQMFNLARAFKADILTGIHNTIAAHVSKVTNAKSIIFTDTEHAKLANFITFPFSDVICTPSCFKLEIGKKQVRYNGYHELAYLHPNYFKPDISVMNELGLKKEDRFVIVRFVAYIANHDVGHLGFDMAGKRKLVNELEKYARVFISSETPLPEGLSKYKISIPPEKLHSALYYASLYVGDSGAATIEAALLGTPTVHFEAYKSKSGEISDVTSINGIFDELVNKYEMFNTFSDQDKAIDRAIKLIQNKNAKNDLKIKKERMLGEQIDVTGFMTSFFEDYRSRLKS